SVDAVPPLRATPFTTLPGREKGPTFSPDGTRIAFSWDGNETNTPHIYVKLIGAGEPLQLTRHAGSDLQPAWSPDGLQIAFLRSTSMTVHNLYLVEALGGEPKCLTPDPAYLAGCAWAPDSREIVFSRRTGGAVLWRVTITGGQPRPLNIVGVGFDPAVSARH